MNCSSLFVLVSLFTLTSVRAHGQAYEWNVDASGSWEDSNDWLIIDAPAGSYPNNPNDFVLFSDNISAPRSITLHQDATINVFNLVFSSTQPYSILAGTYGLNEIVLWSDDMVIGNINVTGGPYTISTNLDSPYQIFLGGVGSLIVGGVNTYSVPTFISSETILIAGSTTGLSPVSTYNLSSGGTLALGTGGTYYDSHIGYLTDDAGGGPWTVSMGSASLVLLTGGNFDGVIEGSGGIFLLGGTLAFQGVNTFTGSSIVYSGTELSLNGSGSLSCPIQMDGNFSITGITPSVYIFNQVLSGAGLVTLGSKTFEFASAETSTYSGSFTGSGGVTISNGSVVFNGTAVTSDYSGTTTISNSANLTAATANCMSPNSPIYLAGTGSFVVQGSNTVLSISGDSDNNYTIDIQNTDLSLLQGGGMDINFGGV
ncbi:MAG: hypothetical protein WCF19_05985, partial [Chlamydiales bacterium]